MDNNKKEEQVFCPRPFYEMTLQHNGDINPCCLLDDDYILGNIKESSLMELWNGERIQKLRSEFLTNNIITCKKNIELRSCHKFYDYFLSEIKKTEIQEDPPKKLDIRLNGKCNIQCIMCTVWMGDNGVYEESSFWNDGPEKIFPYLKNIDLLGGEPFVQSDTFRLIDEVSDKNKDCLWSITTNGNWNFQGKIKNYLDKIQLRAIIVSLDGVNPITYKRIRKGGNYKQVMTTINQLIEYNNSLPEKFVLQLDFVLQKDNYRDLIPFYKFCSLKKVRASIIYLQAPKELSIENLAKSELRELYDDLVKFNINLKDAYLTQIINNISMHI